uniref:Secernin 1 n=1 Tax=Sus scrofa TaxID=9823 RepID=A0A8D0TE82_PIG
MAQNRIFKPRKGVGLDTSVNKVRDTFLRGEIVLRHQGPRVATKTAESRRDAGDSGAWLLKARVLPFETAAIPAGTKRNKNRAKRSHFPRRDSPSPAPLLLPGAYASRQRAGAARPRAGVGGGGGGWGWVPRSREPGQLFAGGGGPERRESGEGEAPDSRLRHCSYSPRCRHSNRSRGSTRTLSGRSISTAEPSTEPAAPQCTYISVDQVPRTHAIMISRPAWLWGAEMGANEHGVCIANEAINAREPAAETEALLGMDLVRLGLERSATAKEALDVIVALLEEHGQGGNYYEDAGSCHSFQSAYLIVDCEEAWVLETVGKYWAAEKITEGVRCVCNQLSLTTKIDAEHPELRSYAQSQGWWTGEDEFNFSDVFSPSDDHLACCSGKDSLEKQEESITVQTMIDILRDKASGVCIDSESFLTTASVVSVLPQNRSSPCIHYFTGTPDPSRSIFKPFIFVDDVKLVPKAQSPCFGDNDPARKEPRFQEKPDRRHELYKAHEWARAIIESDEERGQKLRTTMLDLEQQGLEAMEELLSSSAPLDPAEVADLFYDCVDTEIKFFK